MVSLVTTNPNAGNPLAGLTASSPTIDMTGLSDPFNLNTGLTPSTPMGPSQSPDYTGMGLDPFGMGGQPTDLSGNAVVDTAGTPTDTTGGSTDTSGSGAAPSIGSDLSNILSGLGGALTSSNVGNLALFGGLYSLLQKQASNASEVNTNLANQITQIGAPDVAASKDLLTAFQSGSLTTPYSQMVANAEAENQKAATSQMQQVSSLLANAGGGNLQSAMASEGQQITGQQALANSEAVVQAFNKELTDSLNLTSTGGQYVQAGIMQEIQSNTQLQGQLAALMGMLAQAYARSTSGTPGAGGTSGGIGGAISTLGKGLSGLISTLLGAGKTLTGGGGGGGGGTVGGSSGNPDPSVNPFDTSTPAPPTPTDASGNPINTTDPTASNYDPFAMGSGGSGDTGGGGGDTGSSPPDMGASPPDTGGPSGAGGQAADGGGGTTVDTQTSGVTDQFGNTIGAASAAGSIYTAVTDPTASTIIGGASGVNTLANDVSKMTTGAGLGDPGVSSTLGAAGEGLGIASAIQNPSNPVGDVNAALDVARLYNTGATLAGSPVSGLAADLAGIGMGLGVMGAAYTVSQVLASTSPWLDPNFVAKTLSAEVNPAQTQQQMDTGLTQPQQDQLAATLAADRAAQAAGGVAPVTPYTGNTPQQADAWLKAVFGAGGGSRGASANQQQA
jgi:hypothetical protein